MSTQEGNTNLLIVDDGRPGTGLWRIFSDGGVAEVDATMTRAQVEALAPHRTVRVEHLSNVEPYEVLGYEKCSECDGSGTYSGLCIFSRKRNGEVWPISKFDSGSDDLNALGDGLFVRQGNLDCSECDEGGWVLRGSGLYVERDALVGRVAA